MQSAFMFEIHHPFSKRKDFFSALAKQRLFIYTNSNLFDRIPADIRQVDTTQYDLPEEVILQLLHKDVNLGFFKTHKEEILALRAGGKLRFINNNFYPANNNNPVAQLSKKMQTELDKWTGRGYSVTSATIRFIVAWKPKNEPDAGKEHAVILLDLILNRHNDT